jgi:hypothetical protein
MSMSMGLGAGYVMGGAVPPELGPHPLTLDFSPDPMHPEFPRDFVDPIPAYFDDKLWDSGLRALLALREFAEHSAQWMNIPLPADVLTWQVDPNFVRLEIERLRSFMENDRANYMPEIIAQHENAPFYWISLLGMTNGSKPASLKLMQMAMRIGEMAAIHFKSVYRRPRPSAICPGLAPPFGPPGHPAFPSGHALQAYLITESLMEVTRPDKSTYLPDPVSTYKKQLKWLARRVARNRERAGLHYESDSAAGQWIGEYLFDHLLNKPNGISPTFYAAVRDAKKEWGFAPP